MKNLSSAVFGALKSMKLIYPPGDIPGTWCQTSKVASAVSKSSARHRALELASVHNNGQGKSMKWENSGVKDLATVLVILSPCWRKTMR